MTMNSLKFLVGWNKLLPLISCQWITCNMESMRLFKQKVTRRLVKGISTSFPFALQSAVIRLSACIYAAFIHMKIIHTEAVPFLSLQHTHTHTQDQLCSTCSLAVCVCVCVSFLYIISIKIIYIPYSHRLVFMISWVHTHTQHLDLWSLGNIVSARVRRCNLQRC